jgi:asparagine synthase (glutamine-hydrolysing)
VGQSYPNYFAAKLASKFVKVVLSGAGGDELFGGYPWRYFQVANSSNFDEYVSSYYLYWQRLLSNTELRSAFSPVADSVSSVWTRDIFRAVFKRRNTHLHSQADYVNHSLYLEAKTFLHGLLVVEDKLSMANSVETRVPFLDNDLVDLAMRIPVSMKVGDLNRDKRPDENDVSEKHLVHGAFGSNGKILLRRAMQTYLPGGIAGAEKQGFSAPDASWFSGKSIDFVQERLLSSTSPIYSLLSYPEVSNLVRQHLHGQKNRRLLVWSLLNVNEVIIQDF